MIVSNDPKSWNVPQGMKLAWDGEMDSLLNWWQKLRDTDDGLHPYGGFDSELLEIQKTFVGMWYATHGDLGRLSRACKLVRAALRMGLDVPQAARLLGLSQAKLVSLALRSVAEDDPDIDKRILADALVRDRTIPWSEVARRTDLTQGQVATWAKIVGVKATHGRGSSHTNPAEVREYALELFDQGMKPADIVKHVREHMPQGKNLTASALYQWVHRTGRKAHQKGAPQR